MIAYFDCFCGASGDMILGAAIDAGVRVEELREDLKALAVSGYSLEAAKIKKQGFAATQVKVVMDPSVVPGHRHLKHIVQILESSSLSPRVRERAGRIFQRLAEAEAKAHGSDIQKVHFHEVGAVDAIVDIVGACLALERLGITRMVCSPIPTGSGTVKCEHGIMPVPAPGTAALLEGVPLAECDEPGELTTPTGAAILTTLAENFGPPPAMVLQRTGYGAGQRDGKTRPNLFRLLVGAPVNASAESDEIEVLETNLDDCTAEQIGFALERLMQVGALDAYALPIVMKKSRPGTLLTVLCEPHRSAALEEVLFIETTTLGVRRHRTARSKLQRRMDRVSTAYGEIDVKVGSKGTRVFTVAPEYESCRAAALDKGVSLREVYAAAERAWRELQRS